MSYHHLYEYYIKGLGPYEQRDIGGAIQDLRNPFSDRYIVDRKNGWAKARKTLIFSLEKYEQIYRYYCEEYAAVNRKMIANGRAPLFDLTDMEACMRRRDELLTFGSEEELAPLIGAPTFAAFIPPVYQPTPTDQAEDDSSKDEP